MSLTLKSRTGSGKTVYVHVPCSRSGTPVLSAERPDCDSHNGVIAMSADLTSAVDIAGQARWPESAFDADDRILILAPHPDDESLACGGIIQRGVAQGLPVRVAFLSYGDNNEWSFMVYRKRLEILPWQVRAMGEVRHAEALAAAGTLGVPEKALNFLGYPDFGTLHIWCEHWGSAPPFRSMLTHVTSVPYPMLIGLGPCTGAMRSFGI